MQSSMKLWVISKITSIETIYFKQRVTMASRRHLPPAASSGSLNLPPRFRIPLCTLICAQSPADPVPPLNTSLHMHTTNLSTTCRVIVTTASPLALLISIRFRFDTLGYLRSTLPELHATPPPYRSSSSRAWHNSFGGFSSVASPVDANALRQYHTAWILHTCIPRA
jgi:hypothetical protein